MFNKIKQFFCNHDFEVLKDRKLTDTLEIETTHRCTKCGHEFKSWYSCTGDIDKCSNKDEILAYKKMVKGREG